jgi:hypothetical protein
VESDGKGNALKPIEQQRYGKVGVCDLVSKDPRPGPRCPHTFQALQPIAESTLNKRLCSGHCRLRLILVSECDRNRMMGVMAAGTKWAPPDAGAKERSPSTRCAEVSATALNWEIQINQTESMDLSRSTFYGHFAGDVHDSQHNLEGFRLLEIICGIHKPVSLREES